VKGVLLNTYSDSIESAKALVQNQNLVRLSSAEIKCFSTVQKLTSVNPWAIHSI
jgi:hypothetical protein